MSLDWPGNASGIPLEELEEVSGVLNTAAAPRLLFAVDVSSAARVSPLGEIKKMCWSHVGVTPQVHPLKSEKRQNVQQDQMKESLKKWGGGDGAFSSLSGRLALPGPHPGARPGVGARRRAPGGPAVFAHGTRPGSARNGDVGPPSSRLTTRRKVHEGPVQCGLGSSRGSRGLGDPIPGTKLWQQ
ncbi:hypothetical protein L3Q82_007097 [Scortum barcoo]|uniref:Uncharacterized protein n=1 Tax=Scortum barcoo TaxID=214431 RepID=A0ACB8WSP2_9TELE|nr:hypothetical protein L3Q82_007097 [Scortum barcoo]